MAARRQRPGKADLNMVSSATILGAHHRRKPGVLAIRSLFVSGTSKTARNQPAHERCYQCQKRVSSPNEILGSAA